MEGGMRSKFSQALFLGCVLLLVGFGQSDVGSRITRIEKGLLPAVLIKGEPSWTIEERMKHYKAPGVSIAVINNFKIEWAKAYGVKDVETNEPVTTETLFQAGSISKPVGAMVALKRVQDGKIALDQDINARLTSWKLPDNEFTAKKKVTLANLLSHTGGLTVHGFPGYAVGKKLPTLPEVLDGTGPTNTAPVRVNIEPGVKFRYSGGGTTIAQLAIMDIEKKPYPQIAKETVFGPLGMNNSTYSQPLPDDWRKKAASGHRGHGNPVEGKIHIYPEMAAAGLWTTPTDLAKFAIEVQLSLAGKSNKVLSREMVEKMTTPFIEEFVGMGFFIEKHGDSFYFGHGGADEGFRAQLLAHKTKGYGAVVMVNSDNGQILGEILKGIAREYSWDDILPAPHEIIAVDPGKLDDYVGRFKVNSDRVFQVVKENGKLYGEQTEAPKVELFPISETGFIRRDQDVRYTFVKNSTGKAESVQIYSGGRNVTAPRTSDAMVPYEMLAAGKVNEAMDEYRKIKRETPQDAAVEEGRLNSLGYGFMRQNKLPEAIAIFKLNVEFYPKSSNVYDSLGEAYMKNGDKELAIANYRKSVELNPKNTGGIEMLKKLENK
jgi:CubicO group peptidase (beta-lactamase class C family)